LETSKRDTLAAMALVADAAIIIDDYDGLFCCLLKSPRLLLLHVATIQVKG
jgi:hypothetical protein